MLTYIVKVINAKDANRMELVLEDFSAVEKREFKPEGTNNPIYMVWLHLCLVSWFHYRFSDASTQIGSHIQV